MAQAKLRRLCPAGRPLSPSVQSPSWISLKINSFFRFKCLCLCHAKIHPLFQLNFGWGPTVLTSYHLFCLSDSFTVMGCCTSCKKAQLVPCKKYIMLGRVASPLRVLNWVVYPLRITCAVSLGQSVPLCRMPGQIKDCKESCGVSAAFARDLPVKTDLVVFVPNFFPLQSSIKGQQDQRALTRWQLVSLYQVSYNFSADVIDVIDMQRASV